MATEGDRERIYDWASLSKLVVAVGTEFDLALIAEVPPLIVSCEPSAFVRTKVGANPVATVGRAR